MKTTAGKAKDTAESTKLGARPAWQGSSAPSTRSSWVTYCLHPSFPSKSGSGTCLQPLLLLGWWHITGLLICPTVSAVGAGSRRRGSLELSRLRLQYGFREMCGLGESQGKLDHFMEEKHILPTHPHPPSSPKATSKTDHRDGTEEHALQRGEGKVCPRVERQTQPHSLVRPHTINLPLPAGLGSVPAPFPTHAGSMSTLAGGGQRLVDGGLEAAHVLHRGTVCFH